jgi:DNA-binding PadR family transcriptional regulator
MSRANTTQYALLGYLMYQPLTGYEIKKSIDNSIGFFWQESYGHIYPMLKRLEKGGMIIPIAEVDEGLHARKRYAITDKGKKAFLDWMSQDIDPLKIRYELLLKLFFSARPGSPDMLEHLKAEEKRMEQLLAAYDQVREHLDKKQHPPEMNPDAVRWRMTLNYGYHFARATLDWCRETSQTLKEV